MNSVLTRNQGYENLKNPTYLLAYLITLIVMKLKNSVKHEGRVVTTLHIIKHCTSYLVGCSAIVEVGEHGQTNRVTPAYIAKDTVLLDRSLLLVGRMTGSPDY